MPIPIPMITAAIYGGATMRGTLPMLSAQMSGGPRAIDTAGVELPMLTASMRGGVRMEAELPMLTGNLSGTVTTWGTINASLPALTALLTGTVTGLARMNVALPMLRADMHSGGALSAALPMLDAVMSGKLGAVGHIAAELPMLTALLSGTMRSHGDLIAELPMIMATPSGRLVVSLPMMRAALSGRLVEVVTYEAYAVNLQPSAGFRESAVHEVTRYDWAFDHAVRWRNRYYGVKADGLYLLGGDLDGEDPIAWALNTGQTTFGSRQEKVCREAFVHGRVGRSLAASVTVGERTTQTYEALVQTTDAVQETAQATRVKYGRGLKAVYWDFGFSDPEGGPADIDAIEFGAAELSRKVFS